MKKKITVSEFMNTSFKDYSLYVLEDRAIPSVIDGLKPVQRKSLFVAEKHIKKSYNKVATLAGKIISDAKYHHGNVSAENAIINVAQDFKNNLPMFDRDGQFGSINNPEPSASRYISVKLNQLFESLFKDDNLLEYKEDEGTLIEPKFYLPIIPTILANGCNGIAVGHATIILNRDTKDIIRKCISYIEGKQVRKIKLGYNEFSGKIIQDKENSKKYYINGSYTPTASTQLNITELPINMSSEKYEKHLDKLEEDKVILSWENDSKDKNKVDYIVRMKRSDLQPLSEKEIYDIFKLSDPVTENMTLLDENDKLIIFDSAEEILKYFVDFRLGYYEERKKKEIEAAEHKMKVAKNKAKFIKLIIDGKIIINKKTKKQILDQILKNKLDDINGYDYLLTMPLYSMSKEKIAELNDLIKKMQAEVKECKKKIPKEEYIKDLEHLLKNC